MTTDAPSPVVAALHVAKATRLPMRNVDRVEVEAGRGIVGDRHHGTKHRHVTVQSLETLAEVAEIYGAEVAPHLTRRNVSIDRGVVPREPGTLLRLGPVLLQVVRVAAPCKLLDDFIGPGAHHAMRHRGGSVCRVLEGGVLAVGDVVDLAVPPDPAEPAGP